MKTVSYLTGWDEDHGNMIEYRLDRMARVRVSERIPATCNGEISRYRYDDSRAAMFGRFSGEEITVTLAADPGKVEIITDRFGKTASFLKTDGSEARAHVRVCKSEQFFGWVASMGKAVRVVAPQSLIQEYKDYLRFLLEG